MKTSPPAAPICMRCTSTNISTGKLISGRQDPATAFKPDNIRFWSFSLTAGVAISKAPHHACLDCGFIWTEADPAALEKFIASKCKPTAKQRCRAATRP